MKRRIALWALVGLAVACAWVIFGLLTWPHYNLGRWMITGITAPSALIGRMMALPYYCFILLNGVCYAMAGLASELALHSFRRHNLSTRLS